MAIYHFPAIVTLHLIYQQLLHFSVPIRLKSHTNNCWDAYQKCNCQKSTTRRRRQRKRISDQDTCSFFQLLPSQWNFHGRFGPLSTLEYVRRQQWSKEILIYFFFFFPKQSQSEEEEEAEEKLLWMEFTAEDHLQPFAMLVGVEWTVKLSRLKNPFSGRDETIELTWSNGSSSSP